MGTFSVTIDVGSPDRQAFREVEALVDTGATFTWMPHDLLEELGHQPVMRRSFELADGRVIECDIGEIPVRIGDDVLTTVCVFGDDGGRVLLGAVTLEQFLLAPDPVRKRLVPVVGLATRSSTSPQPVQV